MRAAILLALSLAAITPAAAAGRRGAPRNDAVSQVKLHSYAACLTAKRPKIVRETLAMDYRSTAYDAAIRKIGTGRTNCAPIGKLGFSPVLLAGGMAEAAFEYDYRGKKASRLLPADWNRAPINARGDSEVTALCLVQRRADAVQALLATRPASSEEAAAFRPIVAELPACVKNGEAARFNKPFLRAVSALALYRAVRHYGGGA